MYSLLATLGSRLAEYLPVHSHPNPQVPDGGWECQLHWAPGSWDHPHYGPQVSCPSVTRQSGLVSKAGQSYGKPWSIFSVVHYAGFCGLVGKGAQSYSKPFFSVVHYAGLCGLVSKSTQSYSKPWSIFTIVQYAGLCGLVSKSAQSYSKPWSIFTIVQYAGLCGLVSKGAKSYGKPWSIFPVVLYAGTVAMYWHVWLHGSYLTKAVEIKRDFYVQYSGWEFCVLWLMWNQGVSVCLCERVVYIYV